MYVTVPPFGIFTLIFISSFPNIYVYFDCGCTEVMSYFLCMIQVLSIGKDAYNVCIINYDSYSFDKRCVIDIYLMVFHDTA